MSSVRVTPVFLVAIVLTSSCFFALAADERAEAATKSKAAATESEDSPTERGPDRRINFPEFPDAGRLFRNSDSFITPTAPEVVRPRSQAETDQRNNWVFLSPDDMMRNIMGDVEELPVFGPDGRDLNSYTALERFIHRQSNPNPLPQSGLLDFQAMNTAPGLNNPGGLSFDGSIPPNSGLTANLPGMEVLVPTAPSLSNPFGLPSTAPRTGLDRQIETHQQQLEAYKKLLNPSPTLPQVAEQLSPLRTEVPSFNSPFALPEGTLNPANTLNGTTTPGTPLDLDAAQGSRSRGRSSSPPPRDFSVPQRAF